MKVEATTSPTMSYQTQTETIWRSSTNGCLAKHLQIEQADFFGESFGGIVAVAIAVRHPELVGRVATYASPFGKFEDAYQHYLLGEFMGVSASDDSVTFQRSAERASLVSLNIGSSPK